MIEISGDSYKINVLVANMEQLDRYNDNIDIVVYLKSGDHFTATLFTPLNVLYLMRRWKITGESDSGHYLWASDMILIDELTTESIKRLVQHMFDTGVFYDAFVQGDTS